MTQAVLPERRGGVLEIVLNRPDSLNAFNGDLLAGFIAALETARADDQIRAVSVRGNGRGFCAGGDVRMFGERLDAGNGIDPEMPDELHRMIEMLRALPKPVVAIIHGPCAGAGMSLALACDLAIAADDSFFNLAYTAIGAAPDGSSTYFLPRHVGLKRATAMFFNPRKMTAQEVLELGLINEIVPGDELLDRARAMVDGLANGPTYAFGAIKKMLQATFTNDLHDQLALETQAIVSSSQTEDFAEGVRAFLSKRPPTFKGR